MNQTDLRNISGWPSIMLDAIRLSAALIVFYAHAYGIWFPGYGENTFEIPAHTAVVVFFVLSGYIIAFTTTANNRGPLPYAKARFSRLYSVMIPTLIVTALAEYIVRQEAPELLSIYSRGVSWPRYLISGAFLNELWFSSSAPRINAPLWSLSFEFWYYVIFGCWFFKGRGWKSYLLLLLVCLIAGPKILVMMPIWIAGYIAYKTPGPNIRPSLRWLLCGVFLVLACVCMFYIPPFPYAIGHPPLFFANQFITDWMVSILMAVAFWLLPSGNPSLTPSKGMTIFRKMADLTFPIYALHAPLLIVWRALCTYTMHDSVQLWQAIGSVLILTAILGYCFEASRPLYTRFFEKCIDAFSMINGKKKTALND